MVALPTPRRGDVFLVALDPSRGHEIQKPRPAVVISPDELHSLCRLVMIAPLTSGGSPFPYRVECRFKGKAGRILLDQLRSVDRTRLMRPLGRLEPQTHLRVLAVLQEMFAP